MYAKPPTAEEAAFWGLSVEDATVTADVWPDEVETINVFSAMQSQWRRDMGTPTGLAYASLPVVMQGLGVRKRDQPYVFEGIRVMEEAALGEMRRMAEEARREEEMKRRMKHGR